MGMISLTARFLGQFPFFIKNNELVLQLGDITLKYELVLPMDDIAADVARYDSRIPSYNNLNIATMIGHISKGDIGVAVYSYSSMIIKYNLVTNEILEYNIYKGDIAGDINNYTYNSTVVGFTIANNKYIPILLLPSINYIMATTDNLTQPIFNGINKLKKLLKNEKYVSFRLYINGEIKDYELLTDVQEQKEGYIYFLFMSGIQEFLISEVVTYGV